MMGSVKKRGKTYQYVVDVGIDPFTGKRKQKTKGGFKRQKDAQAALNQVLHENDTQGYVEPSKEIFSTFIEVNTIHHIWFGFNRGFQIFY